MSNSSSITEFLLLVFAERRELQLLHFWLFLGIYLSALLGNGLIITAIACDHHLHTPMYFFLVNLSLLDLGSISTTLPKAMANSLWDIRDISYMGCAAQIFFFMPGPYSLDGWFDGGVQKFMVNEVFSAGRSVTHGVLQVFTLGSVLANIFSKDMEELKECTLTKTEDATELWK
ncbi:olfactory receptor 14I1-like [Tyto alba]|uniref:olfactory receptor 14I1-like n=1 Tax=Tyto alba TaxID=56313 RepID=UPI001C67B02F|nr:olfactory receptor 14I1-like [Tyto alba]